MKYITVPPTRFQEEAMTKATSPIHENYIPISQKEMFYYILTQSERLLGNLLHVKVQSAKFSYPYNWLHK